MNSGESNTLWIDLYRSWKTNTDHYPVSRVQLEQELHLAQLYNDYNQVNEMPIDMSYLQLLRQAAFYDPDKYLNLRKGLFTNNSRMEVLVNEVHLLYKLQHEYIHNEGIETT